MIRLSGKKLLGLVGSYRRTGNSEIVIKAIAERMAGWDCSFIRLPALQIKPCKGCYACLMPGVMCNINYNMQWLLERLTEADAIIVAAPNYVLGPVGIMKMIADRTLQSFSLQSRLKLIKTAVVLTLGREDYRGYSDTALVAQVAALGLKVNSVDLFHGTFPGEVVLDKDFDDKISRIAAALLNDTQDYSGESNRCPRCFSDLFRMRDGDIECALCKSLAKKEGDNLKFYYFHPEFGEEGRHMHLEWLVGKKEAYSSNKTRLQEIQKSYSGGDWLSPETDVLPAG